MMKMYDVWGEGYAATIDSSPAVFMGSFLAESFDEAVYKCVLAHPKNSKLFVHQADGSWTFWGCRLFDNEAQARMSFG